MKRRSLVMMLTFLIVLLTPFTGMESVPSSSVTSDQIIGELQPPEVTIIEENDTGITLKVDFFGFQRSQVEEDDLVLDVLTIPSCGSMEEMGKPALPKYGTVLAVPFDVDFQIDVLKTSSTNYPDYLVYPAQEPAPEINDGFEFPTPPFYIDEEFYGTFDDWYPTTIVEYEAAGTLRDVRVLPLGFLAFQHNPAEGVLRFYWSITVRIDYITGPFLMSETRLATRAEPSPYFESLYSSLLGYEQLTMQEASARAEVLEPKDAVDLGWDFLIITNFTLLEAANTIAARRNAEGLSTHVVTTNDIPGGTAADIKAYIQNAYNTWNPRPSYLLLLGDAEHIPTFYQTAHPYGGYPANTWIGTDLYYAIMNGPEAAPPFYSEYWTPDIFYGRIPVDNLAQANLVINKIIEYEDRQWMCLSDVPGTALVAGYFQDDDPDGYEDRRFILTLEEIRDFLLGEGFDVERLYQTHSNVMPTNYNNGYYDAGKPLPVDLLRPTYPWNADATDINDAINNGRFVVFHRDHGGSANAGHGNGWGHPYYLDTDVAALNNADHFTVVFTINCETGWFDGETDTFLTRSFESLSEEFLRESDGGAVGVIGASRVSYSGHNDWMAKGFVDAIWPNFDSRGPAGAQLRMGEVLNYGKLYYRQFYGASVYRKAEYEIFHYFGDPTMAFKIPTLDRVSPTVTITHPPDGAEIEADQTIDVQCIISDNNDPNPTVVVTPSDPILPPLTIGSLTITVNATDCAGNVGSASVTVKVIDVSVRDITAPSTFDNYDGLWHNTDLTITLTATDDVSGVAQTHYSIKDGPTKSVSIDGHPLITTEGANNKLEYWSVDNAGNEEDHHILTDIKLDKTKPAANAGQNQTVDVDTAVTFDASGSTDDLSGVASYEWNFGDGKTGTGMTVNHTYTSPGAYTVTLTVKDAAGNTDADSITVTVVAAQAFPIWIIGVVVAVGIVITIVIFYKKRSR